LFSMTTNTSINTLSLHDSLPISSTDHNGCSRVRGIERLRSLACAGFPDQARAMRGRVSAAMRARHFSSRSAGAARYGISAGMERSEEHTSELQSRGHLV